MRTHRRLCLLPLLVILCLLAAICHAAGKVTVESPYVFTDEKAAILIPDATGDIRYSMKTITADGWGPTAEGKGTITNGRLEVKPLAEGIHIVTLQAEKPVEVRFLAITPPQKVSATTAKRRLRFSVEKLFNKQPYTIIAMGDSVTATGDYEGMLATLLRRATGNTNIKVIDKGYSGRSVDAAVRFFPDDVPPNKPDLGLLMYGLNDYRGGCPLDGYLEQYAWIADQLSAVNADTVMMMPTPDVSMGKDFTAYTPEIFQTLRFAEALRPLAVEHKVMLADTFRAIWGKGGASVDASGKAMWPKYPPGYASQYSSIIETGSGDGVHPNALGHLAIARAVFNAMMGIEPPKPALAISATSEWTMAGLVSHVTVKNSGKGTREGRLDIIEMPDGPITTAQAPEYKLKAGEAISFDVRWPQIVKPADLLNFPANTYVTRGTPMFAALDFAGEGCEIHAVDAPMEMSTNFIRDRQVVSGNLVTVKLQDGKETLSDGVRIPDGAEVGRIPLIRKLIDGEETGWAVAEVAYCRYGAARPGEATVDGKLDEWADARWVPVGEKVQARWTPGIIDGRADIKECYLRWAFKAGTKGIYLGVQATGQVTKDRFTLFLDTREPALLGTPGRYYWASGELKDGGKITLSRGETSKTAPGMTGAWQATPDGMTFELFLPYELVETTAWPAGGDLGLSIWWVHQNADGSRPTNLFWAEDGHPWNTRWYGVVRLDPDGKTPLPYMVRVK